MMIINLLRYHGVVKACALEEDFQNMQGGDMSEIADQGANLSGGQKARLALARYHPTIIKIRVTCVVGCVHSY